MKDKIFLLIEDIWDQIFCEKIIEPVLNNSYNAVLYYKYIKKRKERVGNFIKGLISDGKDYIILGDLDEKNNIIVAKEYIYDRTNKLADKNFIHIVIKEIESWIIAGLDEEIISRYDITLNINNTEIYSKEDFIKIIPKNQTPNIFMNAVLETYELEKAKLRNNSFNNFIITIS